MLGRASLETAHPKKSRRPSLGLRAMTEANLPPSSSTQREPVRSGSLWLSSTSPALLCRHRRAGSPPHQSSLQSSFSGPLSLRFRSPILAFCCLSIPQLVTTEPEHEKSLLPAMSRSSASLVERSRKRSRLLAVQHKLMMGEASHVTPLRGPERLR
jgi:hypothetical protein